MWRNDIKCKYMFLFTLNDLARKGLIQANVPKIIINTVNANLFLEEMS